MSERERFEAWCSNAGYPIVRGFGKADNYEFVETRRMWEAWQARCPEGWRVVPMEPSKKMMDRSWRECAVSSPHVYRAMLAAAPQPGEES